MYRTLPIAALALALLPVAAQAQWTIHMRAMQNPLAVGQCTAIEVVVLEPNGHAPIRPDGKQASGWDFELDFVAAAPDAFAWQDERRRFLCARAPTAATALVVARYPGRHLAPAEVVPGVVTQQSVEVVMQGVQPPPGQYAGYPSQPPADPYAPYAGASPSGSYPAQSPAQTPAYPQPPVSPHPAYPQPAYSPPPAGQPAYPQSPQQQAPQPTPVVASAPAPAPPPAAAPASAPPPPAAPPPTVSAPSPKQTATKAGEGRVRTGKQFLRRLLGHVKQTADEAATNTAGAMADAAGEMVDDKLGVAGGGQQPAEPADLAAGLASGRVVLTNLRFVEGTAQMDQSSGPLIVQLAAALIANAGQFLIEAHVDGGDPTAAKLLSDQRAGSVKAALVAHGVPPMQLMATGYGATRPLQDAATSARIEIARTQ